MTYPDAEVVEFVSERFVAYRVNTKVPREEDRALLASHRLLWEPGFVFLDHGGRELRRTVGFLPPQELLAELRLVLGKAALLHARHPEALLWFEAASGGTTAVAPEALFWAGIAAYRIERDLETLRRRWSELRERFPASTWWTRADVFQTSAPGETVPEHANRDDRGPAGLAQRTSWRTVLKFVGRSIRETWRDALP